MGTLLPIKPIKLKTSGIVLTAGEFMGLMNTVWQSN